VPIDANELVPSIYALLTQPWPTGIASPTETAAGITPTNYAPPAVVNVLRYGADPTGVKDSTYAFQQATLSTYAGWQPTSGVCYTVFVPPGRYKFAGVPTPYGTASIFVRAGMAFICSGIGGTFLDLSAWGAVATHVFYLGWGFINGVATQDAGGQPPEFAYCFIEGGPSGGGAAVYAHFNGGALHDVWFSACGLGVYQSGFNIYDCVFDIGLVGILKGFGTDEYIEGCLFFNQAGAMIEFDASVSTDSSELIISACQFSYPQNAAIVVGSGGSANIYNWRFNDCFFISNAQYSGFNGYLSIAASNACQMEFNNCAFRNMKGYAVDTIAVGGILDFNNCLFDGNRTNSAYSQSTTAGGVIAGGGTVRLTNCQYRNLQNNGLEINGSAVINVRLNGVQYSGNTASSLIALTNSNTSSSVFIKDVDGDGIQPLINAQSTVQVKWKNLNNWVGASTGSGSYNYVLVPYQHASVYQITLSANLNVGGSGSYSKSASIFASKMNDFNGAFTSFITTATAIIDPSESNAAVAINVLFGGVPGTGTSTAANSNSGSLFVSWPNTYSQVSLDIQPLGGGWA